MGPDNSQIATPAQWLEHSEAWRYDHLDLAPSDTYRRLAIQEHERQARAGVEDTSGRAWARLPLATQLMMIFSIVIVLSVLAVTFA